MRFGVLLNWCVEGNGTRNENVIKMIDFKQFCPYIIDLVIMLMREKSLL